MSCRNPKKIIQSCQPIKPVTKSCEPVTPEYLTVRNIVLNWLYDLDTSVGFGASLANYVRKVIGTTTAQDDTLLSEIKAKVETTLIESITQQVLDKVKEDLKVPVANHVTEINNAGTQALENLRTRATTLVTDSISEVTDYKNNAYSSIQNITKTSKQEVATSKTDAINTITLQSSEAKNELAVKALEAKSDLNLTVSQAKQDIANQMTSIQEKLAEAKELLKQMERYQRDLVTFKDVFNEDHLRANNP